MRLSEIIGETIEAEQDTAALLTTYGTPGKKGKKKTTYTRKWPFVQDEVQEGNRAQLGIPANATDAELRKARKAGGKKGKRAHWLLNMRKGNQKR